MTSREIRHGSGEASENKGKFGAVRRRSLDGWNLRGPPILKVEQVLVEK